MKKINSLLVVSVTALLSACGQNNAPSAMSQVAEMSPTFPAYCSANGGKAIGNDAEVVKVADGYVFLEGPVWSAATESFYFSEMDFAGPQQDGPRAIIHRLQLPDTVDVFIDNSGSNGLAIDGDALIAMTHDDQTISKYDLATKERSTWVTDYHGKHYNSPNDGALHSQGHFYFSDPNWQLGERENETGVTGLYWRDPQGQVTLVDGERENPNGVTLSPDEKWLYVGDKNGAVMRYAVNADGSVGDKQLFATVDNPDGMAVDCAGNLYVTSHGPGKLHVLAPDGNELANINIAPQTTNIAFGGPEHKTILITAGGGLYRIQSPIAGSPY
ncbi:SMP-30/gluconolactonase/LRE family protein [Alteromonadaceae bacterium BrNp21-10]|nr:SMP-30/gluconolactonase/LRE family protein [Alteromonadaceae bacterium BrNp21-10]